MSIGGFSIWEILVLIEHELLLFAGVFFLLGAVDELIVDFSWLWMRLTGRATTEKISDELAGSTSLHGWTAMFIPAWQEARVVGTTVAHALAVWPHDALRIYVGCYRNDAATIAAVQHVAASDNRVRVVIHDRDGPTTKADCLNRLYRALEADELRRGEAARMVVLHDAEDMVDPAALSLLDAAIGEADFVQLPVRPEPQRNSRWIGSHYCEEFAEAHAKTLPLRDALCAGIPSAGVGCGVARQALAEAANDHGDGEPFAADCLTEDYELGLGIGLRGGRQRFLRARTSDGRLVATRSYFPGTLGTAVRQKSRWVHGIAFQGWDRLGWSGSPADRWMRMRDRRGPLTALVLLAGYALLALALVTTLARQMGHAPPLEFSPGLKLLLLANLASFAWRGAMRFAFTAREYGVWEGLRAILRIPIANIIAIMAGRRAIMAYLRSLGGKQPSWDKTAHHDHPVLLQRSGS